MNRFFKKLFGIDVLEARLQDEQTRRRETESQLKSFCSEFDAENTQLKKDKKKLENDLTATQTENRQLQAAVRRLKNAPEIFSGQHIPDAEITIPVKTGEKELYPGEISGYLKELLYNALRKEAVCPPGRKQDVVTDLIEKNIGFEKDGQKNREICAAAEKAAMSQNPEKMVQAGFRMKNGNKHCKMVYHGDDRYLIVVSKTPSDIREGKNMKATVKNRCLLEPRER